MYLKDTYRNARQADSTLADSTKFMVQQTMSAMFNWAVHEGLLYKNPYYYLDDRDKFQKSDSDVEYLTVAEVKAIENVYTGSPITKQTFLFCCFTGLRFSDVKRLQWCHIQKTDEGDIINIPAMQKTGNPVWVPIGKRAKQWMPERTEKSKSDELVFPGIPTI